MQPASMPTETFAFVFTGGKISGCEKGAGVVLGISGGVAAATDVFRLLPKWMPIAVTAASRSGNKTLKLISLNEPH